MLEVEQKYALAEPAAVYERLNALGVRWLEPIEMMDRYYNHPCKDFAHSDEALRLRRGGAHNWLTYKGPKLDPITKTRREIELPLPDGWEMLEQYQEIFLALGFRHVRDVHKRRTPGELFHDGLPVEVAWDELAGLGTYLELEMIVEPEDLAAAKEVLANLAAILQLPPSERRSYLELLLQRGEV
jgi:adenylate cyclase class 2